MKRFYCILLLQEFSRTAEQLLVGSVCQCLAVTSKIEIKYELIYKSGGALGGGGSNLGGEICLR